MKKQPVDRISFLDASAQQFISSTVQNLSERSDLDTVLERVTAFLGAEAGSIFVLDPESDELVLQHATGKVGEAILGLRLRVGQGVVGWVVKHREDLIVPYAGMDARFFEGVDESTGFSTRSILCSPLLIGDQVVGAIEVLNKQEGTFNDDDLVLLRAIAHEIARFVAAT